MLRLIIVKNETTTLGLKVRASVKALLACETLGLFAENLKSELKKLRTGNHLHADTLYKVEFKDQYTNNEVVHIKKEHFEKGKRIIMTITK